MGAESPKGDRAPESPGHAALVLEVQIGGFEMARAVYGRDWFFLGDDIRLKIDHPDYDHLAIRTVYTRGGMDKVRGYYLSVAPYNDRRMAGADGKKINILAVSRRSDKSDAAAVIRSVAMMPMVVADVCEKMGAKFDWSDMKVVGGA